VAKIKNINEKMVYKITTNNFNKIFKLLWEK
jgi:Tat protein secretion system quality control protein TatD with DNase activity